MQHTITLTATDELALTLKLERANTQRAVRRQDPLAAADYLSEVVSDVLEPERAELGRERRQRLEEKLDELPKDRRDAILAELGLA